LTFVSLILNRIPGITKPQRNFLLNLFLSIFATHSKINFLNLARHSSLHEKTFRRHFRKDFDFARFNQLTIDGALANSTDKAFAQDASFCKKAGKKTFGLDKFWNGSASRAEKGLEVSLISIVDVKLKQAFALSAQQTPALPQLKFNDKQASRVDFYLQHLQNTRPYLPKDVKYGLFDGFYAKFKFVEGVRSLHLQVISKLRCDANLRYLYEGPQKQRGRPRKYDGKVDFQDWSRFDEVKSPEAGQRWYSLVVWSVSLKREIRVVVLAKEKEKKKSYAVLFSTDVKMSAELIVEYYRARFSIEFIFRDSKQYGGLSDCQARDEKALNYHFNAAVSSVNVARVMAQESEVEASKKVFSMSSLKQRCFNEHLLEMFISKLGLEQTAIKNHPQFEFLRNYATIDS
jgi:hypothetical protein